MKRLARRILGWVGLELYGARGGAYLCRAPHAGRAEHPRSLPSPCHLQLRRDRDATTGQVEVNGNGAAPQAFASGFVRLPEIADHSVDTIGLTEVYEFLFRQDRRHAIREWRRILKPGGTLVLSGIPDFESITAAYVSAGCGGAGTTFGLDEVFRRTHGDPATANSAERMLKDVFTRESVVTELTAAGYEVDSSQNIQRPAEPAAFWLHVVARKPR